MFDALRVLPGAPAAIAKRDPGDRLGFTDKAAAALRHRELLDKLQLLQNRLWAEQRRSLLLVLQGMDASGKDGTIRTVFSGVNPQGTRVTSFKAPAGREAAHDYLWRVHEVCPMHGEIGHLQPLALRGRARGPGAVARARAGLAAAVPSHPRVRADARRRRHDRS